MNHHKLKETIADISYIAGTQNYYSGDSRADISSFIIWAKQFETINKTTNWDQNNYMLEIEKFSRMKLALCH